MATKSSDKNEFLDELTPFLQQKGFVWGPFPEIYGGLSGFYSYGPLGKLLKNKIEDAVRRVFTQHGFWELECPIILPDVVWKASGHLETFVDRTISCKGCKAVFRADKLIEESHDVAADGFSDKQLLDFITSKKIACPRCSGVFESNINKQNLMMKTKVAGIDASLRPETATVTYLPFKRYFEFFRRKLPVGVFQIGKVFRNEVSPRQHLVRGREFTQAEGQLFIDPEKKHNWEKYDGIKKEKLPLWTHEEQTQDKKHSMVSLEQALKKKMMQSQAYAWCVWLAYQQYLGMGIPAERIRIRQHHPDERAFYAVDAWDIEVKLNSFGWTEMCGVHDRTDYDLKQHEKFSKENLQAVKEDGTKIHPHVLEIAFGTDRPVFAVLDIFYEKVGKGEGKTMFKVPYHLAPVDVAVFPLLKKDGMPELALDVKEQLEPFFVVEYDGSGSIGRRYLRAAEGGTPYCVTIDHESLKNKSCTIRDRDSEKQIRVKIKDLHEILHDLFHCKTTFSKAGKKT
jgi:glycyl-tRNA synthetase